MSLRFSAEGVPFDGGVFSLSSFRLILKGFLSLSTSKRDPLVYPRRFFTVTGIATSEDGVIILKEEGFGTLFDRNS